jgi:hypothetical protein
MLVIYRGYVFRPSSNAGLNIDCVELNVHKRDWVFHGDGYSSILLSLVVFTRNMEAPRFSETLVSFHITTRLHTSPWRWAQHGPPKRSILLHHKVTLTLQPEDGRSMTLRNVGSYHITTRLHTSPWRWRQQGSPKRWYPSTSLYGITLYPEDGRSMILRNISSYHIITQLHTSPWRWRQHSLPKHWYPTTSLNAVTLLPQDGGCMALLNVW